MKKTATRTGMQQQKCFDMLSVCSVCLSYVGLCPLH